MTKSTSFKEIHPFDQLSAEEIIQVSTISRKHNQDIDYVFNTITLKEPNKELMLSYLGWNSSVVPNIEREAVIIAIEKNTMKCFEGIVSLTHNTLKSWKYVPGVQAILTRDELLQVIELVVQDERVKSECLELGILDMEQVYVDPWSVARYPEYPGTKFRMVQGFMYLRTSRNDHQYAHPLDFVPIIDVGEMKIVHIERIKPKDSKLKRPTIPLKSHNYLPEFMDVHQYRKDIKPIVIQQPEGVSFQINRNEINWQKWNMHVSINHREGIIIRNVNYLDGKEKRPLFYRISLSEMIVPYADPTSPHNRKQAFDVGEFGFGRITNSLKLGCDCVGSIYYFDAVFNNHEGMPFRIENAVCVHEEDFGVLMKHTDMHTGVGYSVRSRRLVVSQFVTAANYDYGIYFYFYQDGRFEYEVKATGILNTHVLAENETTGGFGTIVAPQVNGQYHQHFFTVRVDPMIDGVCNSVEQVDIKTLEYPTGDARNVNGNGFTIDSIVLKDTVQGQCTFNNSRFWRIINKDKIHPVAKVPVGWKIWSNHSTPLYAKIDSLAAERGGFAKKTLWVTPYNENQMFAGGFYCNQSNGEDTVEVWANQVQSIEQKDIVIWYTFGITHIPRVEDFPIMPVEYCGFTMKPCNFFMCNPALDIAPSCVESVLVGAESCCT